MDPECERLEPGYSCCLFGGILVWVGGGDDVSFRCCCYWLDDEVEETEEGLAVELSLYIPLSIVCSNDGLKITANVWRPAPDRRVA